MQEEPFGVIVHACTARLLDRDVRCILSLFLLGGRAVLRGNQQRRRTQDRDAESEHRKPASHCEPPDEALRLQNYNETVLLNSGQV
jgi:hypothetical protein